MKGGEESKDQKRRGISEGELCFSSGKREFWYWCSKEKKEGGRQTAGGDGEVEVVCGFDEGFGTNNDYFEFITFRFKKGLLTSLITF